MKNIEEIKATPGIYIKKEGPNGFGGTVFPIEYKKGKLKKQTQTEAKKNLCMQGE